MTQSKVTTALPDDHPHWSEPAHDLSHRVSFAWVATTWLLAVACTAAITALALWIVDMTANPFENGRSGVAMIIAGLATFISFVAVTRARLAKVDNDRLLNSLAVGAMHVVVAIVAFLVGLALTGGSGDGLVGAIPDGLRENLGILFSSLDRSAAAAILAVLLVPGTLPATGPTPPGTQSGALPRDRQL